MKRLMRLTPVFGGLIVVLSGIADIHAAGVDITSAADIVQGVPNDDDWPAGEPPAFAIDDDSATKFLHRKGDNGPSGIRVTPASGPAVVTGITLQTANDQPGRDPTYYWLYGSNDSIDGPYTTISHGPVVDFAAEAEFPRFTVNATEISFDNTTEYTHYQLLFPMIRGPNGGSVNSMQIGEIQLLAVPEPSSIALLCLGLVSVLGLRRRAG